MPTDTAEPTATATTTQAPANTAPVNAAVPPAQPTAAPPADIQAQVLAAVDSLLHDIDVYVSAITAQFRGVSSGGNIISGGFDKTVNCQDVVTSYNHGIVPRNLDVSQATITVQNAYNTYLAAIPLFQQATQVWAEVCQTALANGETKEIGDQDRGNIGRQMDTLKNMLNGVANELRTP